MTLYSVFASFTALIKCIESCFQLLLCHKGSPWGVFELAFLTQPQMGLMSLAGIKAIVVCQVSVLTTTLWRHYINSMYVH